MRGSKRGLQCARQPIVVLCLRVLSFMKITESDIGKGFLTFRSPLNSRTVYIDGLLHKVPPREGTGNMEQPEGYRHGGGWDDGKIFRAF